MTKRAIVLIVSASRNELFNVKNSISPAVIAILSLLLIVWLLLHSTLAEAKAAAAAAGVGLLIYFAYWLYSRG